MPGFDWDRARSDRIRAERGTEPVWGPDGPPRRARKPVPEASRTALIERRLAEFKALSYEAQLVYFDGLKRDLTRALGCDEAAAKVISERFKPYLKLRRPRPPVRPAATPATGGPSRPRPAQPPLTPSDDPATAILQFVRRRPGQLTQKECLRVLRGPLSDVLRLKGLARDPQTGSFA